MKDTDQTSKSSELAAEAADEILQSEPWTGPSEDARSLRRRIIKSAIEKATLDLAEELKATTTQLATERHEVRAAHASEGAVFDGRNWRYDADVKPARASEQGWTNVDGVTIDFGDGDTVQIPERLVTQMVVEKHNATLKPHASEQGADTKLVIEIAQESAVEFADDRINYVSIQMDKDTWAKLQARYAALSQRPTPE